MFILAIVMVLSVATAAVTVYNNNSKADVLQESVVDKEVDEETTDEDIAGEDEKIDDEKNEDQQVTDNEKTEDEQVTEDDTATEDEKNEEKEQNIINPKEVRFMQSSIKNQTGEYTVLGNAEALKAGTLKPEDMPLIRLWKDDDGKIWTLDHRRLAAFRLAELESVPFVWATEEEVNNQMWKMTTTTDGLTIRLKLGKGKNMTVE